MKKPYGYWTKEKCAEEALKYNTRKEFQEKSKGSYLKSQRNNWLDEICFHMVSFYNPNWTKDRCKNEALKYTTRSDFQKNSPGAYLRTQRNGWLNDICDHMIEKKRPNGYWTKKRCEEEALKYNYKSDFQKNSSTAYSHSCKMKIIDEVCSHMITFGNRIKRCIYVYEFSDNSAYIGLTYNINNRNYRHLQNVDSVVYKKSSQSINYKLKQLTEYIDINEAKKLENYYVNKYKNSNWTILNMIKTGGLGGNILKWTKDKCQKEALKYSTKVDFKKELPGAYKSARINGWLSDLCSHMIKINRRIYSIKYTKDICKTEALKYNYKSDFQKNSNGAYNASIRNKWANEICSHMT